ncbi:hypothetical protein [Sphaerotilus sp.]|uniref:hypothetical protein n=1 Tax=Sphaerotilus sp. TaxID=2093942 RepID=UPI00286E16D2|nr:hypothetical protein [Sphaerotilus sp.]
MIDDLVGSSLYWLTFMGIFISGIFLTKSKKLDFTFIFVLVLAQYCAHLLFIYINNGVYGDILLFGTVFYILFMATYALNVNKLTKSFKLTRREFYKIDRLWVFFCKIYVIAFFGIKIITTPIGIGELDLGERLGSQNENKVLFFIGLAIFPMMVGCMYDWVATRFKLSAFDYIVVVTLILGLAGSASKSALLPLVLAYFGVVSAKNIKTNSFWLIYCILFLFIVFSFIVLSYMLPGLDFGDICYLIFYRVVANTDSIEYLYATRIRPADFTFSGWGALLPFFAKFFGYRFDYPVGVWLHGIRYGVWDGFGPNSGFVMDYFANMGVFGVGVAVALGIYMRLMSGVGGAVGLSFLSISYLTIVDLSMFEMVFGICFVIFLGCLGVRFTKCLIGRWYSVERGVNDRVVL